MRPPLSRAVAYLISDEPSIHAVSWDQIVAEHGATLYRAAFRVLHHCGDAEDVTQEVLMEAYRKQQVSGTPPGAALLRRMATLRAIINIGGDRVPDSSTMKHVEAALISQTDCSSEMSRWTGYGRRSVDCHSGKRSVSCSGTSRE